MKPARIAVRAFCFACCAVSVGLLEVILRFDVVGCVLHLKHGWSLHPFHGGNFLQDTQVSSCS